MQETAKKSRVKSEPAPSEETTPETGELTGKQAQVISLLVSGTSIENAAKTARVNPATVHAWHKKPAFVTAYREARRDVVTQATATLQAACRCAVGTLVTVASDKHAPSSSRVSAARTILEMSLKSIELEDLAARIEALEALQEAANSTAQRW